MTYRIRIAKGNRAWVTVHQDTSDGGWYITVADKVAQTQARKDLQGTKPTLKEIQHRAITEYGRCTLGPVSEALAKGALKGWLE